MSLDILFLCLRQNSKMVKSSFLSNYPISLFHSYLFKAILQPTALLSYKPLAMEPIGRFGKRVGLIKLGLDSFGFLNRLQNKLSPSSYMLNQLGSIRLNSIFSNNNNNNNNNMIQSLSSFSIQISEPKKKKKTKQK